MAKVNKREMLEVMLEMLDAAFGDDPQVTYRVGTRDYGGLRYVNLVILADIHGKTAKIDRLYDYSNLVHVDQIRPDVSDCVVAILKAKADPTLIEGL